MSKVLMPRELTAENRAKPLLMGEFNESVYVDCPECDGEPTDGDLECEICHGDLVLEQKVPVSWSTIKDIYAMAVKHLGEEVSKTPGLFIQGDTYEGDEK